MVQGAVQLLHCLSEVSPLSPEGKVPIQVVPLKKFGEEHLVHKVIEEQYKHGAEQLLQVQSLVSPNVPSGQGFIEVLLLRKLGEVQHVQKVA